MDDRPAASGARVGHAPAAGGTREASQHGRREHSAEGQSATAGPRCAVSQPGSDARSDEPDVRATRASSKGYGFASCDRSVPSAGARGAGTLSGATAPPEITKAIAWSMVQSVGVSSSIGTTSR